LQKGAVINRDNTIANISEERLLILCCEVKVMWGSGVNSLPDKKAQKYARFQAFAIV
jgi:hypothetical protein